MNRDFPSITQMAQTLVHDASKWVRGGMMLVPKNISEERLGICSQCEFYKEQRCTKCGCQMRVKTTMATSRCPIGKWSELIGKPVSTQTETNPPAS